MVTKTFQISVNFSLSRFQTFYEIWYPLRHTLAVNWVLYENLKSGNFSLFSEKSVFQKITAFTYWLVTPHIGMMELWLTPHSIAHNNVKRLIYRSTKSDEKWRQESELKWFRNKKKTPCISCVWNSAKRKASEFFKRKVIIFSKRAG